MISEFSMEMSWYFEFFKRTNFIEDNNEEKLHYIKLAIENCDDNMMFKLAAMYQEEKSGVLVGIEGAVLYYKNATKNGNLKAMNNLAKILETGEEF